VHKVGISQVTVSPLKVERKTDFVAEEAPLHIFLNQKHYVTILCSPNQLKELAAGYLLSEGVLKSIEEIQNMQLEKGGRCLVQLKRGIDAEKRISVSQPFSRLVLSACGSPDYWPLSKLMDRLDIPKVPLGLTVKAATISESVKKLNFLAETFRKTGGVHIAALYSSNGELMILAEDVGRHNAVDKTIGTVALKKMNFDNGFLASSGRLTGDVVLKAARMRIPVVASITAAVDSGIDVAERTGVTLIGFVRGNRMNIYTCPERIVDAVLG